MCPIWTHLPRSVSRLSTSISTGSTTTPITSTSCPVWMSWRPTSSCLASSSPSGYGPGRDRDSISSSPATARRAAVRRLVMDGHGEMRELPCIVERGAGSAALQELRLISANSDNRKLSSAELGKQVERVNTLLCQLKDEGYKFPGRMRDHVAEACKVSKSKVARLNVIRENLDPSWQSGYQKGALVESAAYALAKMPPERQRIIFDGMKAAEGKDPCKSAQEYVVRDYGERLEQAEKVKCAQGGPCVNLESMRKRIMSQSRWERNYCRQCCERCEKLTHCKMACPSLADKIKRLKEDAKERRKQEGTARLQAERPKVEAIQSLWKRFGEARAAAGKSVEECFGAAEMYYSRTDDEKYEKTEQLKSKFSEQTKLPYGYGCYLRNVQAYVKLADLLSVSLDYLLCRTDDPAGFASRPEPEGQLVLSGWMPGGTLPFQAGDVVADFDLGEGTINRMICFFDGRAFRFKNHGATIDLKPVRWMTLPPVEEE